jgi:hypothetical protein
MPPKKRKGAGVQEDGVSHEYTWLLTYRYGSKLFDLEEGYAVFSSKDNAIAGLEDFMDNYGSAFGGDWKNGVEGFGKEDEENDFGFEYFGDSVENDGVLLENDTQSRDPCTVHLKRLKLNDPKGMEAQVVTNPYHTASF